MNFSDILRNQREKAELSQGELAKKADLQPAAISHFESGRRNPSFDNLRKLADALNISTDVLLGRDGIMRNDTAEMEALFRNAQKLDKNDFKMLKDFSSRLAKND